MNTPPMNDRIRPVIILPPGQMSKKDVAKLNANGICVVEAKEPDKVRFAQPPPFGYSAAEQAAIELSRIFLTAQNQGPFSRATIAEKYVEILVRGGALTPLAQVPPIPATK